MKRSTKVWLIAAVILALGGCILFAGVMSILEWDFTKLSTVNYVTNTHEISQAFDAISINTDTADIAFALSEDGSCSVECYEEEKAKHIVAVKDGTLSIDVTDERSVLDFISLSFTAPRITLHLPKAEFTSLRIHEDTGDIRVPDDFSFGEVDISLSTGDIDFCASVSGQIRIKGSTGDIKVENISAGALELSVGTGELCVSDVRCAGDVAVTVSTGKACLSDIACRNVYSEGSTGDVSLNRVIAEAQLRLKRSTGDVKLDGCDAAEIFVETDTGDVTGNLLTDKLFVAEASTGRVDVPETTMGGICEIRTGTGDIRVEIQ